MGASTPPSSIIHPSMPSTDRPIDAREFGSGNDEWPACRHQPLPHPHTYGRRTSVCAAILPTRSTAPRKTRSLGQAVRFLVSHHMVMMMGVGLFESISNVCVLGRGVSAFATGPGWDESTQDGAYRSRGRTPRPSLCGAVCTAWFLWASSGRTRIIESEPLPAHRGGRGGAAAAVGQIEKKRPTGSQEPRFRSRNS